MARAAGREGLDFDSVAGFDGEDGLGLRGVEAPRDRSGRGEEGLNSGLGERGRDTEETSGAESGCVGEVGGPDVLYITGG